MKSKLMLMLIGAMTLIAASASAQLIEEDPPSYLTGAFGSASVAPTASEAWTILDQVTTGQEAIVDFQIDPQGQYVIDRIVLSESVTEVSPGLFAGERVYLNEIANPQLTPEVDPSIFWFWLFWYWN